MAEKTTLYTVDGMPLFVPLSPMQTELDSLADPNSGRTDDGVMHINFVRSELRKITYRCGMLTGEELRYLKNLVQGKIYTFGFDEFGERATMQAYTSAVQYEVDRVGKRYKNVQFSIIEV